jgi:hypothetical protein
LALSNLIVILALPTLLFHLALSNNRYSNNHGKVYNLKKEAKIEEQIEKGIYPNSLDLGNILRVAEMTEQKDLKSRQSIGDHSKVLLGVARKVEVLPFLNVVLHSRSMFNLAGHLSSHGRLILGVDATGGLINLRNTPSDGKIQHTFLNLQCTECLLEKDTASKFGSRLFTPVTIAERVSYKNRARCRRRTVQPTFPPHLPNRA